MKRILLGILFSLILCVSLAFSQDQEPFDVARIPTAVIGGSGGTTAASVAYCTGATTCNSPPAQCDVLCEDGESSTACHSGGDTNCWNTWTETLGTDDTITPGSAATGVYPCSGTVNTAGVINMVLTAASHSTNWRFSAAGDKATLYYQFYFNLTGITGAQVNDVYYFGHIRDSSGNAIYKVGLKYVSATPDVYRFLLQYYNQAAGTITLTGSNTIAAVGTWYRINLHNDGSGNVDLKVNGSTETGCTATDLTTSRVPRRNYIGPVSDNSRALTIQFDNIAVDDDTEPSACN
jgi:hypothetical protein